MKNLSFLKKIKKIFPSRKFTIIMGLIFLGALFIFLILFFFEGKESFTSKENKLLLKDKTLTDLVQKDTDGDSIPDWEEALWGTDKTKKSTFEGMSDVAYIENKKKDLQDEVTVEENSATETDKFAREFFTAYAAMTEGGVDEKTMSNFSSAIGQKVVDPTLIDKYTENDVKKNLIDSAEERAKYYGILAETFEKYKESGIGEELNIASTGIITFNSTGSSNIEELLLIADAYTSFAEDVINTEVPESLIEEHLNVANSASNTGISVSNMTKMIDDPITGLAGLSQYQKYSEALVNAVLDLENAL